MIGLPFLRILKMIAVCTRCKTVTHTAPRSVNQLGYLCDHCAQTPDLPLFNQPTPPKRKPKPKPSRHPAEGGPDPVTGEV